MSLGTYQVIDTHLSPTRTDILARPPSVTARERRPHPLAHNPDVRCDRGHPRSYAKQKEEKEASGKETE